MRPLFPKLALHRQFWLHSRAERKFQLLMLRLPLIVPVKLPTRLVKH